MDGRPRGRAIGGGRGIHAAEQTRRCSLDDCAQRTVAHGDLEGEVLLQEALSCV